MKKLVLFVVASAAAGAVLAAHAPDRESFDRGVRAYLAANGHPKADSVRIGVGGDVEAIVDPSGFSVLFWNVPGIPFPESLPVVDEAGLDTVLQAAKSPRLKVLENKYFALLDALPGDPVPQTPSLEEAKALVDERLGVALAAKYRELLSELDLELSGIRRLGGTTRRDTTRPTCPPSFSKHWP